MKSVQVAALAAFAALAAASGASAQSGGSVAFGPQVGTTGIGAQVEYAATPMVTLRGTADFFELDGDFSTDDVNYEGEVSLNTVGAFADLHPFNNAFFVSGGAYFGERSADVSATATGSAQIGDQIFTAAQIGTLTGTVEYGDVAPFLGLGWNDTFTSGRRWGFRALIGAAFAGDPEVSLRRTGGVALPAEIQAQLDAELEREEQELQQEAEDFAIYPVAQVGFSYRF